MNMQLAYPFSPVPSTHMFDKPVILVVEDDCSLSDLLCDTLSAKYPQFCVISASSGQQALALATLSRPCLLLLDDRLNGPMNGIELFDTLHGGNEAPIATIMLSADVPHHDLRIRRILLVRKPDDLDAVVEKVLAALPFGDNSVCVPATRKITGQEFRSYISRCCVTFAPPIPLFATQVEKGRCP